MAVTTSPRIGVTRWSTGADAFTRSQMDASHSAIESKGAIYLQSTAALRPTAGTEGRYHYATDTTAFTYDDGIGWRNVSDPSTVLLTATQTLTNKTISGASNTLTNIAQSSVTSLTTDLGLKAPLASPTFTGVPLSTTAAVDTNTTQVATTAFVVGQASATAPVMNGTAAVGTSLRYARTDHIHASDTSRAPLASPTFTGTPAAPTAAVDTNTTQVATTAYVIAQAYLKAATATTTYAPLASPTLTGVPLSTTAAVDTNTTQIATTAYVIAQSYLKTATAATTYAPLASPTLTGVPAAPTPAVDTNTTQVATTAYVVAQGEATVVPLVNGTAATGSSLKLSKRDHVHPSDTSRAPLASPTFTGTVTLSGTTAGSSSITGTLTASGSGKFSGLGAITICTSSTRPGSPSAGQVIYETDTALFFGYNSTAWSSIGGGGAAYQTTGPTGASIGALWVDSDDTTSTLNTNDFLLKSEAAVTYATKTELGNAGYSPFLLMGA